MHSVDIGADGGTNSVAYSGAVGYSGRSNGRANNATSDDVALPIAVVVFHEVVAQSLPLLDGLGPRLEQRILRHATSPSQGPGKLVLVGRRGLHSLVPRAATAVARCAAATASCLPPPAVSRFGSREHVTAKPA